jgi:hypothetical protein
VQQFIVSVPLLWLILIVFVIVAAAVLMLHAVFLAVRYLRNRSEASSASAAESTVSVIAPEESKPSEHPAEADAKDVVALHMLYRNNLLEIYNDSPRNLHISGIAFDGGPPSLDESVIIPPIGSKAHHYLYTDMLKAAVKTKAAFNSTTDFPLDLFLKSDSGIKYVARFKLRTTYTPTQPPFFLFEPRLAELSKKQWPEMTVPEPAPDPLKKHYLSFTNLAARLQELADETDTPPEQHPDSVTAFVKWSDRNKVLLEPILQEVSREVMSVRLAYGLMDDALTDAKLTESFIPPGDMRAIAQGLKRIAGKLSEKIVSNATSND